MYVFCMWTHAQILCTLTVDHCLQSTQWQLVATTTALFPDLSSRFNYIAGRSFS